MSDAGGIRTAGDFCIDFEQRSSAGGKFVSSSNYQLIGSSNTYGRVIQSSNNTLRSGYIGNIYKITSLEVSLPATEVAEETAINFSASSVHDDATQADISSQATWSETTAVPVLNLQEDGSATPIVYEDTTAEAQADYAGLSDAASILVRDVDSDNFTTSGYNYAGDGLADSWQNQFFGLGNPEAAPMANADGDPFDNYFEFGLGLNPTEISTNDAVTIDLVEENSDIFLTISHRRPSEPVGITYLPEISADLQTWQSSDNGALVLETTSAPDTEGFVTDTYRATTPSSLRQFGRLRVSLP